jgi:antitoxin component of MazEF toxin-antitoxin module
VLFKLHKNKSIIVTTRRVWRQGGSLAITLPASFTAVNNIREGDDLPIVADHILKIIPMPEGKKEANVEKS